MAALVSRATSFVFSTTAPAVSRTFSGSGFSAPCAIRPPAARMVVMRMFFIGSLVSCELAEEVFESTAQLLNAAINVEILHLCDAAADRARSDVDQMIR